MKCENALPNRSATLFVFPVYQTNKNFNHLDGAKKLGNFEQHKKSTNMYKYGNNALKNIRNFTYAKLKKYTQTSLKTQYTAFPKLRNYISYFTPGLVLRKQFNTF